MEEIQHLNKTLVNIFWNYIPNKESGYVYSQFPWINDNIKSSVEKRSNLTEMFYKNDLRNVDHIKVLEKPTGCTEKKKAKKIFLKWPFN